MPSDTTIRNIDVPTLVDLVKKRITDLLRPAGRTPIRFSLAIDGGSSKLAHGMKLVTVVVLSPEIPHGEAVLDIEIRIHHEDSESQAAQLDRILKEYGLEKADSVYLVGDNAAINNATVNLLRCESNVACICSYYVI
jgi:hypothetical protein